MFKNEPVAERYSLGVPSSITNISITIIQYVIIEILSEAMLSKIELLSSKMSSFKNRGILDIHN